MYNFYQDARCSTGIEFSLLTIDDDDDEAGYILVELGF
jgi:hypothetical protein